MAFFSNKVEPYRFSKTAQTAVVTFPSILTVNGVKRLQSQWTNLGWSSSYWGPPEVFLRQTTNLSREFGVHPQLGLKKHKSEEFNRHPGQISGPAQSFLFHQIIFTLTFFSIVVSLCNSAVTHQRVRNWRGRHCHHLCSEGFLTCFRPWLLFSILDFKHTHTHTLPAAGTVNLLPHSWCFNIQPEHSSSPSIRRCHQGPKQPIAHSYDFTNCSPWVSGREVIWPSLQSSSPPSRRGLQEEKTVKKINKWNPPGREEAKRPISQSELSSLRVVLLIVCIKRLRTHTHTLHTHTNAMMKMQMKITMKIIKNNRICFSP